jgi:hypothetical protein
LIDTEDRPARQFAQLGHIFVCGAGLGQQYVTVDPGSKRPSNDTDTQGQTWQTAGPGGLCCLTVSTNTHKSMTQQVLLQWGASSSSASTQCYPACCDPSLECCLVLASAPDVFHPALHQPHRCITPPQPAGRSGMVTVLQDCCSLQPSIIGFGIKDGLAGSCRRRGAARPLNEGRRHTPSRLWRRE